MSQEYISVSDFNKYVKNIFDNEQLLHGIVILGEISSFNISGNAAYFVLKDDASMLPCVMFGLDSTADFKIGDRVLVKGSPNYYTKGGRFNFNVSHIAPFGKGYLYEQFLALKAKLEAEGLFDEASKRPIPKFIRRVGVVTSAQGAVIQDIINVTTRRNDTIDIVLYPVKVQGIGAENEIASGIEYFSKAKTVDCVIVARGGGSLEDLQPFNTEVVARAVHGCNLPIISAVGHETDFTICDFAADLRVPTPSVAAETIAWLKSDLEDFAISSYNYMLDTLTSRMSDTTRDVTNLEDNILRHVDFTLSNIRMRLNSTYKILYSNALQNLERATLMVERIGEHIKSFDPSKFANLGYSKVYIDGKIVTRARDISVGQDFTVEFVDGKIVGVAKEKRL